MPLLQIDAAQIEWRALLELSRDETGIQEVLNGDDTHSLNQVAFGLPSRLIAKVYLFRTIYRGSGYAFSVDPDFLHVSSSSKYWDSVNEKFYRKYDGIDKCHKAWAQDVMAGRPLEGPLGRSWFIEMGRDRHGELKLPWTTLTNYAVQGTAADVMMIARISAYNRIKKLNIPCKWVSTVHDSIVLDCKTKYLQQLVDVFHQVFADLPQNIWKLFRYEWVVPMACEAKFGQDMKNTQKIERSY